MLLLALTGCCCVPLATQQVSASGLRATGLCATGLRADPASPGVGATGLRADPAPPGVGATGLRADPASPGVGATGLRADPASPGVGVTGLRADPATPGEGATGRCATGLRATGLRATGFCAIASIPLSRGRLGDFERTVDETGFWCTPRCSDTVPQPGPLQVGERTLPERRGAVPTVVTGDGADAASGFGSDDEADDGGVVSDGEDEAGEVYFTRRSIVPRGADERHWTTPPRRAPNTLQIARASPQRPGTPRRRSTPPPAALTPMVLPPPATQSSSDQQ